MIQAHPLVSLIISDSFVYIPTVAENPHLINKWEEPIFKIPADEATEIERIVAKLLREPQKPLVGDRDWQLYHASEAGKHPLQVATQTTSWDELKQRSRIYSIQLNSDDKWQVTLTNPEVKSVYNSIEFDQKFPLKKMITVILRDVQKKYLFQSSAFGTQKRSFVDVIFCQGKVFFPSRVLTHDSVYLLTEPVLECEPIASQIIEMLKKIRDTDQEVVDNETAAAILKRKTSEPLLKATKLPTLKKFLESSAWYVISWSEKFQSVTLYLHEIDLKKRAAEVKFEYDAPIEDIVKSILGDVKKYS